MTMDCTDVALCLSSDGMFTNGNGIEISNMTMEPGWVRCADGRGPFVKITKDPSSDRFRVIVKCRKGEAAE